MKQLSRFTKQALFAALASVLAGGASSAWADPLSIAPSVGTFTISPEAIGGWPFLSEEMGKLFQGLTYTDTGLSVPVAGVTVDGQGPGPVRVSFGPGFSGQMDTSAWSLIASDLAFDVGTQSVTLDLTVRLYNNCLESGAEVCAAWASMDHKFDDLSVLQGLHTQGTIDGVMPVEQAVVLQTLQPQKIELSTDLYLDFSAFNKVAPLLFPGFEPLDLASYQYSANVGTLTVSSVPEVSTAGLLALGMVGLAAVARRRRTTL